MGDLRHAGYAGVPGCPGPPNGDLILLAEWCRQL